MAEIRGNSFVISVAISSPDMPSRRCRWAATQLPITEASSWCPGPAADRSTQVRMQWLNVYVPGGIRGIRSDVRQEARSILRHFPSGYELADKESFDAAAVDAWYEARNA